MMKTQILASWTEFDTLRAEWNPLLESSRANTIFLTWEWIEAWRATGGRKTHPFVIAVRDDQGRLVGVAPFYRVRAALAGVVPYRALRVLGDYPTGAEYADLIVRSDCEADATRAIAEALSAARGAWDCVWLRNVAGWNGATDALRRMCKQGRLMWRLRPREFASTSLPGTPELFRKALSSNKRQALKYEFKKIRARDGVRVVRCEASDDPLPMLEKLFDLHHRRRRLLGDDGSFRRRPEEADFYRAFAPAALKRGWLGLYGLEEAGELKAVQLGYVYGGTFLQMQEGFDPEYFKGAGNVLRAEVIDRCIASGVRELDFLGTMSEHKRRWLAEVRHGADVFIGRPTLTNRALFTPPIWPRGLLRTLRRG